VDHSRVSVVGSDVGERFDPGERVDCVAAQEAGGGGDGAAGASMLVAPVLGRLRRARRLEVEVGRAPRRPGRPREDDAQDVAMLVVVDQVAEGEQLSRCRGSSRA
jgi:hypothetical protein